MLKRDWETLRKGDQRVCMTQAWYDTQQWYEGGSLFDARSRRNPTWAYLAALAEFHRRCLAVVERGPRSLDELGYLHAMHRSTCGADPWSVRPRLREGVRHVRVWAARAIIGLEPKASGQLPHVYLRLTPDVPDYEGPDPESPETRAFLT